MSEPLQRVLEPEVMDTPAEARDYDAMDHSTVNRVFVDDFLDGLRQTLLLEERQESPLKILDTGTGTAQIPIELVARFETGADSPVEVTALDLAAEMLRVAGQNVAAAGLDPWISLKQVDCKSLPFDDGSFDAVMSNSIVHHIPEPVAVFSEMWRVLRPGGVLFVRDLLRPADSQTLDGLVEMYAGDENAHQQQMFRDSLHAALTLAELQELLAAVGIPRSAVAQTTDRHWTVAATR